MTYDFFTGGAYSNDVTQDKPNLAFLDQRYLDVGGGDKMLVNLDAENNNLINVKDPVNNQDAVTLNYAYNVLKLNGTNSIQGNIDLVAKYIWCHK